MEDGFLPDVGYAQTWVALWMAGPPSTDLSFWQRFKTGGGVNLDGVEAKAIEAKRCVACGHSEIDACGAPEDGSLMER